MSKGTMLLDAGALQAAHRPMSEDEASRVASILWSVRAAASRLATEKDDSFLLTTDTGSRYVLKVSNPAEQPAELDFEVALHQHVAASECGVPVPTLRPSTSRAVLVPLRDTAGQWRHARLMTFIDGTPLDATTSSPAERERVGRMLARMRHATANFTHPADGRPLAWDVRRLLELSPLLEYIGDPARRALLDQGLERYASIVPLLRERPLQVLHNDFSKSNLIVDHTDPSFVRAVIDFGDSVRTAVAVDVATALLNQLPRSFPPQLPDLFAEGRDLLRGYLREATLEPVDLQLVPFLVMGRVIARALITTRRAAEVPNSAEYTLRNTEQGWAQLRWLLDRSDDELAGMLHDTAEGRQ